MWEFFKTDVFPWAYYFPFTILVCAIWGLNQTIHHVSQCDWTLKTGFVATGESCRGPQWCCFCATDVWTLQVSWLRSHRTMPRATCTNVPSRYRDATAHWEIISGSRRICKYLQPSERFGLVLPFRRRWQFNWAVMATLVPGTSLQPCDSHGFIGNTRGPWGKDRDGKQGFMAPPSL